MEKQETQSPDRLNLSWPHFVNYHVDINEPESSSSSGDHVAEFSGTDSQRPVATYNGVPRELLRNAQPLSRNEIRVLDLNAGTGGMPLVGSLRRVCLSSNRSHRDVYEPLSYTWDDYDPVQLPDDNKKDYFDTKLCLLDTGFCLGLTSNCAKALRSVRNPTTDRTIWVDSICVNQDDPEERSRQVDFMKEIYSKAFTVLLYLGQKTAEKDSSSSLAMSLLGQPDRLQDPDRFNRQERTSLIRLFQRPYFRRMWIVQEVALAQTVEIHCGPDILYVSKFAGKPLEAILRCRVTPLWLRHSKQTVRGITWHPESSQAQHLLGLIFDTASCDCKDDRDRIFALFSLLSPRDKERLTVDYNLSTAQVYTGLSAYLATNGFLWGVLMLAPLLALNNSLGLPSWVPDWSKLSFAGLQKPALLKLMSRHHDVGSDTAFGVNIYGTISVKAMALGFVTSTEFPRDEHQPPRDFMDDDHFQTINLFRRRWDAEVPRPFRRGGGALWTLTHATQDKFFDSWECHLEFFRHCKTSNSAKHLAFMLSDYSTVLILAPDDNYCDQYALVEIGVPLVLGVFPQDWAEERHSHQEVPLDLLDPMVSHFKQLNLEIILSSTEKFPRLADYPELWSHNPITSTVSLTYAAIRNIQRITLRELDVLVEWQHHARIGVQILRDETRLRLLIDEVKRLRFEEYEQLEATTGLDQQWSLDHFLSLFIRKRFPMKPMVWPVTQLHGEQALKETALLPHLMQWARVTYQFLMLLKNEGSFSLRWPNLLMDKELFPEAMDVASFQVSIASSDAIDGAGRKRSRPSVLLEKILHQASDEPTPELDHVHGSSSKNERYWDWTKFNCVMEQRFAILSHVQPDVEKISRMDVEDVEEVFKFLRVRQVLAAHGVDPSKEGFTKIRIR